MGAITSDMSETKAVERDPIVARRFTFHINRISAMMSFCLARV